MKIVLGVFLVAVVGMGGAMIVSSRNRAAAIANDPSVRAIVACQGFVRDGLKAPATAVFLPGAYAVRVEPESPQIRVVGAVDAQNGFGALVRNDYGCVVEPLGESWQLTGPVPVFIKAR